jgi:Tol biopolymer transport system component/DNA-binding winged helix-turn-helix (wHTH) protein
MTGSQESVPKALMEKATFAVYEFGPYRLETATRLLLYEGKSLTLAPKTFDLLHTLVQSHNRVLTKKELMGALWPDSFVEESNLAFQISALRKVLGTKGAEWIETLPKYGYRFSGPVSQVAVESEEPGKITEPTENGHPEPAKGETVAIFEAAPRSVPPAATRSRREIVWSLIAIVGLIGSVLGWWDYRQKQPPQTVVRFLVSPPPKITIQDLDSIALAPDGSQLAFIGEASDGQKQLWLRPLDAVNAQPLAGTELVTAAFWSPDSDSIAFFAGGKLKRIDLHGGSPQTICNSPAGRGTWSQTGTILFDGPGAEIYRVPVTGGEPKPATVLDRDAQDNFHASPQFLPDGRHFIYFVRSSRPENTGIYLGSLDSKERKRLVNSNTNAVYAPESSSRSDSGYLLYTAGTDLVRQAFDLKKQILVGEPAVLAHRVLIGLTRGIARAAFSVSQNGVLAYRTRAETGYHELMWLDRQGHQLSRIGDPADYSNPTLSPDEKKIVVSRTETPSGTRDLWLFDLSNGAASRFTFDPFDETNAVWSPDSREVAFNAVHDGAVDIYLKPVTGTVKAKELLASGENKQIECWSPDGSVILYRIDNKTWVLPVGGGKPTGPYAMEYPAISPDGRWVAYTSNESGRAEVYVQAFPPTEGRWQVSTSGGTEPLWRKDGKELYYLSGDRLMAVDVKTIGGAFEPGLSRSLFEVRLEFTRRRSRYQVADNGRRFLVNLPLESSSPVTITINWPATIKP